MGVGIQHHAVTFALTCDITVVALTLKLFPGMYQINYKVYVGVCVQHFVVTWILPLTWL